MWSNERGCQRESEARWWLGAQARPYELWLPPRGDLGTWPALLGRPCGTLAALHWPEYWLLQDGLLDRALSCGSETSVGQVVRQHWASWVPRGCEGQAQLGAADRAVSRGHREEDSEGLWPSLGFPAGRLGPGTPPTRTPPTRPSVTTSDCTEACQSRSPRSALLGREPEPETSRNGAEGTPALL